MNRIKVKNDKIDILESDNLIEIDILDELVVLDVKKISIKVLEKTSLEIIYEELEQKLDIEYIVLDGVNFEVIEIRNQAKIKVQYKYYIGKNSNIDITKFYNCNFVKELDVVYFNGEGSNIDYHLKTIAKEEQKYNIVVYHNSKNTRSNLNNNGVNIENGKIDFNVTSIVYNKITGCIINQNNRIITFNDNKCEIKPILLIDEEDVSANHSCLIGKFEDDELFYLMSKGISEKDSINLLTRGFLKNGIKENKIIDEIINKYWRWKIE